MSVIFPRTELQLSIFTDCNKIPHTTIHPVELFHTEGQNDKQKTIHAFCIFSKKHLLLHHLCEDSTLLKTVTARLPNVHGVTCHKKHLLLHHLREGSTLLTTVTALLLNVHGVTCHKNAIFNDRRSNYHLHKLSLKLRENRLVLILKCYFCVFRRISIIFPTYVFFVGTDLTR